VRGGAGGAERCWRCRAVRGGAGGVGDAGRRTELLGGLDEKELGEGLGTFPLLLLFHPNPPKRSILFPAPPEPFAYSPAFGGGNQGRTGYHGRKGGTQGCVGEGWQ